MKTINIFTRCNCLDNLFFRDMRGKRKLAEDCMSEFVLVEPCNGIKYFRLTYIRSKTKRLMRKPCFFGCNTFIANIDLTCRIFSDQKKHDARLRACTSQKLRSLDLYFSAK